MSAVRPRALRELLFVVALFVAYKLGRLALTGDLPILLVPALASRPVVATPTPALAGGPQ